MSFIVSGIDMPESCWDCPCGIFNGDARFCSAYDCRSISVPSTRPDWCPLRPMPERKTGRWSGLWSEPDNEDAMYGEKLNEGDTIYLLGVEGTVRNECGAWGWGSCHYVPWDKLNARMPHGNNPDFCCCDNFVSFWELKWNFDDGYDWDGVPFISHKADEKMEVEHE